MDYNTITSLGMFGVSGCLIAGLLYSEIRERLKILYREELITLIEGRYGKLDLRNIAGRCETVFNMLILLY